MEGETYWPPRNVDAGSLVRKEVNADKTWLKYRVYVKRYHDEYVKARNNVRGITEHDDSNYETEKELGRGKRKKKCKGFFSSDFDEDKSVKKSTKDVAPPPNVPLPPFCHDFYDSASTCSRVNESQKKNLDIKVNLHKSRKIQGQQTLRSGVKEKKQFVKDVLDARRKTAERFQKNKSSQSLSSNKVIKASNSKEFPKKQSQEHQIELQMQTERSKCNEQTLSEDNEVTEKNNDKLQQSEKFPQSSNIEKNSNFEDPVDSISSTDDSVANDTAIKEHVDIPYKAASNFKHKRDKSFSSTTSEKENEMQDLNSRLSKIDKKLEELNCKINTVSDRKLEELSCKINTIIMNQGKLNRCLLPQEKKILKPCNMPSLPFRNESDVQAMEKWLCDSENKIALCDYFTSFGSASDERKTATIMMQKLMYNSLAKNYNFDGHGEKRGLKTLKLWTVIEGALSLKFPDSDLDAALKTIKSWLRNASGRKQEEYIGSDSH